MEEEQARQAAAAQANAQTSSSSAPAQPVVEAATEPAEPTDDDDDALLQQAIAMSEGRDVDMGVQDEELEEEEAITRAIEMSMKDPQADEDKDKK